MKIVQIDVSRKLPNGEVAQMTTWVEDRKDLKVGVIITLKNELGEWGEWKVNKIYTDIKAESSDFDWHRKWDNNI